MVLEEALFKQLYQPKRGAFRKLIDIQYREQALALGIREFRRTPSLNTRPSTPSTTRIDAAFS